MHITIDNMTGNITMANGAQDPWKTEYHGYYITNALNDGKDRGAIVIYSNGANQEFGSEHSIAGGVVTVNVPGNNVYGKDDYSIASVYTYMNGYGEVKTMTSGFGNQNQSNGQNQSDSLNGEENLNKPDIDNAIVDQFASLNGGLYNQDGVLLCSWESLVQDYGFDVSQDHQREDFLNDVTTFSYIMRNNSEFDTAFALVIPDEIDYIGEYAFCEGSRISLLKFPKNMNRINSFVCAGAEIDTVILPEQLETIGGAAFWGCQLKSMRLLFLIVL